MALGARGVLAQHQGAARLLVRALRRRRAAGGAGRAHPGAPRLDAALGAGGDRAAARSPTARRRSSTIPTRAARTCPTSRWSRRCSPPGARIGWVACRAHHADVGGTRAGLDAGRRARARRRAARGRGAAAAVGPRYARPDAPRRSTYRPVTIDEEGLRLPPTRSPTSRARALRRRRARPTSGAAISAAQRAAIEVGAARLLALAADVRRRRAGARASALIDYAARAAARAHRAPSPTASTPSPTRSTTTAPATTTSASACTLIIEATARPSTSPTATTRSPARSTRSTRSRSRRCVYAFRLLLPEDAPTNQGLSSRSTVIAPEGSVRQRAAAARRRRRQRRDLAAHRRRACSARSRRRCPIASRPPAPAPCPTCSSATTRAAPTTRPSPAARARRPRARARSAIQTHMTNTRNTPVEALEHALPLRVLRYALRRGSGGGGAARGRRRRGARARAPRRRRGDAGRRAAPAPALWPLGRRPRQPSAKTPCARGDAHRAPARQGHASRRTRRSPHHRDARRRRLRRPDHESSGPACSRRVLKSLSSINACAACRWPRARRVPSGLRAPTAAVMLVRARSHIPPTARPRRRLASSRQHACSIVKQWTDAARADSARGRASDDPARVQGTCGRADESSRTSQNACDASEGTLSLDASSGGFGRRWHGSHTTNSAPRPGAWRQLDAPAVRAHDPLRDRQPEPGALADVLGGEERIEDLGRQLGRHARPGVAHAHAHAVAVAAGTR